MKRDEYLFKRLELLVDFGVKLLLNGLPATPGIIAEKVAGDEVYKPGFTYTEDGNLYELNYVRIA